ncbi:MAG: hypothetical protein ABGW48_05560, partial [Nitrosopumilus sp.]
MEKITVITTIEKIEKLIDSNSGDIGRLEHIIDFLKKKKPLYNTDRIYLENKINSEIIFEEEKPVKKISKTEQIQKLIKLGKGDPGRLEHIQTMLKKQKILYESDRQYLKNNFGIKIIQNQEKEVKIQKIENKREGAMPKDWKPSIYEPKLEKISDKIKIEEKEISNQNKDSKEINEQNEKLNKLTKEREKNDEKLKKEREKLEREIKEERGLIQKQTELTETVNLQKKELVKVKDERTKILKKIDIEKD